MFLKQIHSLSFCALLSLMITSSCFGNCGKAKIPNVVTDKVYATPISQSDILALGGGNTFVIDQPGSYILSIDLAFYPTAPNKPALRITASDVTLDLNNYSLTTFSTGGVPAGISGIEVVNASNVTIKNGRIHRGTGTGVHVTNSDNVALVQLTVHNWDLGGVIFDSTSDSRISLCKMSRNLEFGMRLTNCVNILVDNCDCTNSISSAANLTGFLVDFGTNCQFYNCTARSNFGTPNGYGYRVINASNGTIFNCCEATNNSGDNLGAGFSVESSFGTQFCECKALSNIAFIGNAYGFYLNGAQFTNSTCCIASHQSVFDINQGAFGVDAHGFYSTAGLGNHFKQCTAIGNTGGGDFVDNNNIITGRGIGSGFTLENGEADSTIECCKSMSNNGGNNSSGVPGSVGQAYGIKLGGAPVNTVVNEVTQCLIRGNYLWTNIGALKYGYKDFSVNSTTLLEKNEAFGHGRSVNTAGNVVDTGTMNYMLSFTGAGRNPSRIIFESDIADLKTLDTAGGYENISLNSQ